MGAKTIGGENLSKILKNIKSKKPVKMSTGFYPKSTYSNGIKVASVAFWNEFGTKHNPERPFFRHANIEAKKELNRVIEDSKDNIKPQLLTRNTLSVIGNLWVNNIQKSIAGYNISYTPNASSTIKAKGSSKPLIDTGRMLQSPSYKIGGI